MNAEFDIDAPANMELLGGTGEDIDDDDQLEGIDDEQPEIETEDQQEDAEPERKAARDPVIPRARFDEVNARLHAERQAREQLEAELSALRNPKQDATSASDVDLKALKRQAFELRLTPDGEDEADRIEESIEAERMRRAEAAVEARIEKRERDREAARAAADANRVAEELQSEAAKVVAKYPFLNSNLSASQGGGDRKAIAEVTALRDAYLSAGASPANALWDAANTIAKARGINVAEETPKDKRRQAAIESAARDSLAQPARIDAGVGSRNVPAGNAILSKQDSWERASDDDRRQFLN